ncbi:MAG TPA: hypothetical protein VM597_22790 [Gemmataceae bacterium]|nr:hypothetical protein [Gemmataceae bacterium]
MHGVRDLDVVYDFYRHPDFASHGGPEMVQFLDSVADILRSKLLYFGTSHLRLFLSRVATYPEFTDHPSVGVYAHDKYVNLWYSESWQDGEFFRTREDGIRCPLERGRGALLELLARLKPAEAATPGGQ